MGLAVIFPGQGAQTADMFAAMRGEAASEPLLAQVLAITGLDLGDHGLHPVDEIYDNAHAQPLMVAHSVALWSLLSPFLPTPAAILGYSVGEIAAAHAAGAVDAVGAVILARRRAELMDGACNEKQAMLAIRGHVSRLHSHVSEAGAYLAIVNGRDHLVAAGTADAVARLTERLEGGSATLRPLRVTVASHCPLMAPAVAGLERTLREALSNPRLPFISAWNARPAPTQEQLARSLAEQIAAPVQWARAIEAALERGATAFLELGPGDQMTRILRDLYPSMPARSISDFKQPAAAADWVERVL